MRYSFFFFWLHPLWHSLSPFTSLQMEPVEMPFLTAHFTKMGNRPLTFCPGIFGEKCCWLQFLLSLELNLGLFSQSCPTLCDPMNWSSPGFPVLPISQSLLKLMFIRSVVPSNHLILCFPLLLPLQSFPASGSSPMSQFFASGGQSIGVSAPASVLPMKIQGQFPLGLIGLISLLSKGLSSVFPSTTVQKHQFFDTQPSLWSNSHICTWLLKKP